MITAEMSARLEHTTIECYDANKVIRLYDRPDTFHYIDPPYINANQGHYAGYTELNYEILLQTISEVKGKFMLSSYPSDILLKYVKKYKWFSYEINMQLCTSNKKGAKKTEVLTANYPLVIK